MEIILLEDVTNLGYKDDIVNVKNGYANNYLLPQGKAIIATPSNRKVHAENMRQRAFKEEKLRKDAETLKAAVNEKTIRLVAKVGENGHLFGSITSDQIAEALKEQHNYDVDRKKIVVDGAKLKEVGTHTAQINIYKEIKAQINVEIVAE
ncbi:MAG: 50S ribosomal protein L9 [Bacteroidales bacterium]|jgi:large subunit ribosomal protein L9|nr:50S ribosomal protein L9 [Bacteroidales bacterium]MBR3987297.1 50S ribosomal protein L9 [Bacteroidales bacterium]